MIINYLQDEKYDTDALKDDIGDDHDEMQDVNSNIFKSQAATNIYVFIKQYIQYQRGIMSFLPYWLPTPTYLLMYLSYTNTYSNLF